MVSLFEDIINNCKGLRIKFIAWFTLLIIILLSVLIGFYAVSIRDHIFELYYKKVQYAVELAAAEIDGDMAMQYLAQGYIGPEFAETDIKLRRLKSLFELKYLYIVKGNEDNYRYIYSAYNEGDDINSKVMVGQVEEYIDNGSEKMMQVLNEGSLSKGLDITFDEKYGYVASAYVPIFDSTGKAVAVMSADCSMQMIIDEIVEDIIWAAIVSSTVIVILIALYALFIDKKIVLPLRKLTSSTKLVIEKCSKGTLGEYEQIFHRDLKRDDEIYNLEESFFYMTRDLQTYIKELKEVMNAKQKIETELEIATSIQVMLLPKIFPPFQKKDNFSIYATIEPAKSVGGDYYDFYMVDNDHICLTIADVSGKGVPAALFMMIAKTIMKNHAMQSYENPADVLRLSNEQLSADNDEDMFVTAFFAVYEISTGKLTYANAGHNPPLIYRDGGEFEYLALSKSVVLAAMEGMSFKQHEITLKKNDMLFLYTDGVTEALNLQEELYTEKNLCNSLNEIVNKENMPLLQILKHVRGSIQQHVGGAEQSDDITMLAFRRIF